MLRADYGRTEDGAGPVGRLRVGQKVREQMRELAWVD